MKKIKFIFIFIFLILIYSHSNSEDLNNLFLKLKNAENFSEASNIEKKIWKLWITSGSNKKKNLEMKKGIKFLNNGELKNALQVFKPLQG